MKWGNLTLFWKIEDRILLLRIGGSSVDWVLWKVGECLAYHYTEREKKLSQIIWSDNIEKCSDKVCVIYEGKEPGKKTVCLERKSHHLNFTFDSVSSSSF